MLKIGSLVDGKYKILNEIGHGGMSVVYMAMNEKANKTWAIKEVRKDGVLNFEAVRQGLMVETDMLKRLRHESLPSIVDVIDEEDSLLIVMDYIQGNSLEQSLRERGASPQEQVIDWGIQLCDVLGYLHKQNPPIIYRDVKPANIMLRPNGRITLIDFGTAREYKTANKADTTCLGTVGYAAPEQFGGMGQTDERTDIYCLGATLYHLVTGVNPCAPPYEIQPIRTIDGSLSTGLEAILLRCTRRNPELRYQSCEELMYDLMHYRELDQGYRKGQLKKLGKFLGWLCAAAVFLAVGLWTARIEKHRATDYYHEYLSAAEITTVEEQRLELYRQAIHVPHKAGEAAAYVKLIQYYKSNQGQDCFTAQEARQLVELIMENRAALEKRPEEYGQVCFELGKLFWYYYEDDSNHRVNGMKSAVKWFEMAMHYGGEDFPEYGLCQVYASIGSFYRDIAVKTVEAADKGMYAPFFMSTMELLDQLLEGEEADIVKLELLELARAVMEQYASKLRLDGISEEEMLDLYQRVEGSALGLETCAETTEEKRQAILARLEDTLRAIQLAYNQ